MSNNLKRIASPEGECNNTPKRRAEFSTPPRPQRNTLDSTINPINIATPANSIDTCTQNSRSTTPFPPSMSDDSSLPIQNTPVQFLNNSPLGEEELLLYSMMTLVFPMSTFTKNYASCKYDAITNIIYQITGVKYTTHSIRNYFHRVVTNKVKSFGNTEGTSRWVVFQNNIRHFLDINKPLLT